MAMANEGDLVGLPRLPPAVVVVERDAAVAIERTILCGAAVGSFPDADRAGRVKPSLATDQDVAVMDAHVFEALAVDRYRDVL
jgi:hypothetical protein